MADTICDPFPNWDKISSGSLASCRGASGLRPQAPEERSAPDRPAFLADSARPPPIVGAPPPPCRRRLQPLSLGRERSLASVAAAAYTVPLASQGGGTPTSTQLRECAPAGLPTMAVVSPVRRRQVSPPPALSQPSTPAAGSISMAGSRSLQRRNSASGKRGRPDNGSEAVRTRLQMADEQAPSPRCLERRRCSGPDGQPGTPASLERTRSGSRPKSAREEAELSQWWSLRRRNSGFRCSSSDPFVDEILEEARSSVEELSRRAQASTSSRPSVEEDAGEREALLAHFSLSRRTEKLVRARLVDPTARWCDVHEWSISSGESLARRRRSRSQSEEGKRALSIYEEALLRHYDDEASSRRSSFSVPPRFSSCPVTPKSQPDAQGTPILLTAPCASVGRKASEGGISRLSTRASTSDLEEREAVGTLTSMSSVCSFSDAPLLEGSSGLPGMMVAGAPPPVRGTLGYRDVRLSGRKAAETPRSRCGSQDSTSGTPRVARLSSARLLARSESMDASECEAMLRHFPVSRRTASLVRSKLVPGATLSAEQQRLHVERQREEERAAGLCRRQLEEYRAPCGLGPAAALAAVPRSASSLTGSPTAGQAAVKESFRDGSLISACPDEVRQRAEALSRLKAERDAAALRSQLESTLAVTSGKAAADGEDRQRSRELPKPLEEPVQDLEDASHNKVPSGLVCACGASWQLGSRFCSMCGRPASEALGKVFADLACSEHLGSERSGTFAEALFPQAFALLCKKSTTPSTSAGGSEQQAVVSPLAREGVAMW
eukprot:TRINITY_DN59301_c0_g1_i1.p1 TRINITY_DN59301_c0_g1~~TRINITY_DN59301_c0_g1_i1.p1  ORF type:complete len:780 (+),score=142.92 TRINITY_DN59301_c0_g1_i1:95-2434(+)